MSETCKAKTKAGKRCQRWPMQGSEYCNTAGHDPEALASVGFGSHAQAREAGIQGGRPRLKRPTEIAQQLIEDNIAVILRPHFRTLGFDVEITGEGELRLTESEDGGAKIYGESKDGVIRVSALDDLGAMIAAAERLLDRVYGKPKQSTELTGADGGPIEHDHIGIPSDADFHREVAGLLSEAGALDD